LAAHLAAERPLLLCQRVCASVAAACLLQQPLLSCLSSVAAGCTQRSLHLLLLLLLPPQVLLMKKLSDCLRA
jgi:hypothetical protein